jgi:hypothetical protein
MDDVHWHYEKEEVSFRNYILAFVFVGRWICICPSQGLAGDGPFTLASDIFLVCRSVCSLHKLRDGSGPVNMQTHCTWSKLKDIFLFVWHIKIICFIMKIVIFPSFIKQPCIQVYAIMPLVGKFHWYVLSITVIWDRRNTSCAIQNTFWLEEPTVASAIRIT